MTTDLSFLNIEGEVHCYKIILILDLGLVPSTYLILIILGQICTSNESKQNEVSRRH